MKQCSRCKEQLPRERFRKNERTWDGLEVYCKQCKADAQRKAKNGIEPSEFNERLAIQGGICKISTCSNDATHVDHNHDTGEVRGLLCTNCNTGLGMAKDNPVHLRAMAQYLEDTSYYG